MRESLLRIYEKERLRGFPELDIDKIINDFIETSSEFFKDNKDNDDLSYELNYLELIHYRNNLLWLNIFKKFDFFKSEKKSSLSSLFFDFINIFTLTQNNLQVLHFLISKGFDHQALIILRNHLELFELMLAILGDEELHRFYIETFKANGIELNKSIKFSSTSRVTKKILSELKGRKGFEIYDGFFDILNQLKKEYYKNFSSSVHPDRASITFNAYVTVTEDLLEISLGGQRSIMTKKILFDLFNIEVLLFQYIIAVQIDKHKMSFNKYGKDGDELAFFVVAVWDLFREVSLNNKK